MAITAIFSPNAIRTQSYIPPSLIQVEDNSAETNPAGIKNKIAEKIKKKTKEGPNNAVVGKLRILSMDPVINMTNKNNPKLLVTWLIFISCPRHDQIKEWRIVRQIETRCNSLFLLFSFSLKNAYLPKKKFLYDAFTFYIQQGQPMDFLSFKSLVAIFLFLIALSAGWLPFKKRANAAHAIDFPSGEALASGVFLGVALLHMLPDASSGFTSAGLDYPLAALLAGAMFLFLLWLEHLGRDYYQHQHTHEQIAKEKLQGCCSHGKSFALIAFAMLSLHAFLESAALGLSQDFSIIVMLALAIFAHKWAECFALAIQLTKSTLSSKLSLMYFLIFSLVAPFGVFIGGYASSKMDNLPLLEPTFLALAAGTFLYLGTLHGLSRAVMVQQCCNLRQYSFVIIGFALMAIVAIWC